METSTFNFSSYAPFKYRAYLANIVHTFRGWPSCRKSWVNHIAWPLPMVCLGENVLALHDNTYHGAEGWRAALQRRRSQHSAGGGTGLFSKHTGMVGMVMSQQGSNLKPPKPYCSSGKGPQFPQIVGRRGALSSWCAGVVVCVGDTCFAEERYLLPTLPPLPCQHPCKSLANTSPLAVFIAISLSDEPL